MRLSAIGAFGTAFLVAACSTTPVQCGACPPPVYATVGLRTSGPPSVRTQELMRAATMRVCLSGHGCWRVPAGQDKQMVTFPDGVDRKQADGRTLTATLASRRAVWRGRAVLSSTEGGDEPCACSYTSAHLVLTR